MTDDLKRLHEAVEVLLKRDEGRRVLFWVLEQAGIYRDAFSGDDAATNYVLGSQAVGRRLIGLMDQIDARLYPRLLLDVADMREMERAAVAQDGEDDDEAV